MIATATRERLSVRYKPQTLSEIVGQTATIYLEAIAADPYPCCLLLEGLPGTGKTASAMCLASDLGCTDYWSGLDVVPSTELTIDACRELFDRTLWIRPMHGRGWKVLVIEELEACTSPQVTRFLKVALDADRIPPKTVVVATSNEIRGIEGALRQRFQIHRFGGGMDLAAAFCGRLKSIWTAESGEIDLPPGADKWGWDEDRNYSARVALGCLERELFQRKRGAA